MLRYLFVSNGFRSAACTVRHLPCLLVFVLAWLLKDGYSRAGTEELHWILWPLSRLVAFWGDFSFQYEIGTGYVDYTRHVVIAPACAGVNFLIAAFCMAGFQLISYRKTFTGRTAMVALAAVSAFLMTLIANTVRILGAVFLYQTDIYGPLITADRVHRVFGILVYLSALYGFHYLVKNISYSTKSGAVPVSCHSPVLWYLAVAIGVPVLNGIWTQRTIFGWEHYITVFGGTLAVAAGSCIWRIALNDARPNAVIGEVFSAILLSVTHSKR